VAVCGLLTVACAVSPKLTLVACVGAAVVACIIRFPTFGMALLVSFFLIQGSPIYQQYGFVASRGATVADLGGLFVLLGVAVESVFKRTDPLSPLRGRAQLPFLAAAVYFGWGMVTCLWSAVPPSTLLSFLRSQVEAPLLLLVALLVLRNRAGVRWAMAAYAVSGLLLAAYVSSNFASLHGLASGPLTLSQEQSYRGGQTNFNQNELSVILALVPAMAYLAAERLRSAVRLGLTALTLPLIGFALLVLTSRSTIISLAAGVVLALLLAKGGNGRAALGGFVALGAGVFALVSASGGLPWYFLKRFQLVASSQIGGRGPVWQLALDLFQRHPMGLGASAFESLLPSANVTLYAGVSSSHSDYIGTLVNYGVVGAILLGAMMVLLGREIIFTGDRRNPATILIFAVLIVAMSSGDYLQTHWYWTIMSLAFCYALTVHQPASTETALDTRPNQEGRIVTGRGQRASPVSGGSAVPKSV
jgi:O-antigen ligase